MIFYIIDTTLKPAQQKLFQTYPGVIKYLEGMSIRAFGQNLRDRQILLEETGHGADDKNSTLFVRSMQEQFDIGVVRDGRNTQCDITTIVAFQKPEFGD